MGRLGFNLVLQKKEAAKTAQESNLEAGPTEQQNKRNEGVEMSELLLVIEERNRTIKNVSSTYRSLCLVFEPFVLSYPISKYMYIF